MRVKIPDRQPASFRASARYMAGLTNKLSPDRVAWVLERNLGTTDPDVAALAMDAIAEKSERCKQPAYHLIISFDKNDAAKRKVSPEVMRTIAERAIERLGLGEHQALIFAHKDTEHPHLHILANRVHPVTGKAQTMRFDKTRMLDFAREQAAEFGLNPPRERALAKERTSGRSPGDGEYWRARREGRLPDEAFGRQEVADIKRTIWGDFQDATNWGDLAERLEARGLSLRRKGQGLVLTDGERVVKLSALGKNIRMRDLEQRFDRSFDDFAGSRARLLADDLGRDPDVRPVGGRRRPHNTEAQVGTNLVTAFQRVDPDVRYWGELYGYYRHLEHRLGREGTTRSRLGRRELRARFLDQQRERTFTTALGRVYKDPAEARRAWDRLARGQGEDRAAEIVRHNPTALGATVVDLAAPRKTRHQQAVARAYGLLRERRTKWVESRKRLGDLREVVEQEEQRARVARREYEAIKQHVGAPEFVRDVLLRKARTRNSILARITERMIKEADLSDGHRQHLHKAWRRYHERKRERERDRDFLGVPHVTRDRDR